MTPFRCRRETKGLILRPGALGDVLLTLSSVNLLRTCFPGIRLCWVGYPSHLSWLREISYLEEFRSIDDSLFLPLFTDQPDDRLHAFLASFSFCIAWMKDGEGCLHRRLSAVFEERWLCAPPFPPAGSGMHTADHTWNSLKQWPFLQSRLPQMIADTAPPVFHPGIDSDRRLPSSGIIHPGSGGKHKCRPLRDFQDLSLILLEEGQNVTWLLGYAEEAIQNDVISFCQRHEMEFLLHPPLETVIERLLRATWYLGNDSGISHLAAFCGAESFLLFGPTSPAEWGPKGSHVHFLYNETQQNVWASQEHIVRQLTIWIKTKR